jgi:hypothetical protein
MSLEIKTTVDHHVDLQQDLTPQYLRSISMNSRVAMILLNIVPLSFRNVDIADARNYSLCLGSASHEFSRKKNQQFQLHGSAYHNIPRGNGLVLMSIIEGFSFLLHIVKNVQKSAKDMSKMACQLFDIFFAMCNKVLMLRGSE